MSTDTGIGMGMGGTSGPRAIEQVRTGMRVVDVEGAEIGTVTDVYLGDPGAETVPAEPDVGGAVFVAPGGAAPAGGGVGSLGGGVFAGTLGSDLPQTERARLLREGYVRIDVKGLFSGHRFAASEDIADVSDDVVHLSVDSGRLVH
ncbi:MAG: hypothetical protein J0I40_12960 [Cellulomonas sp.]|uniref:hypothetical protein n=1 Tax=Cellulomonas sp. 73-92 TaxID=1895740 RepID=UPI000ADBC708|nr:hypothetical protein [Cellulomonas sp. 73-92]MBN9376270.1 hypothetical protein [Cellulomonas sp.]